MDLKKPDFKLSGGEYNFFAKNCVYAWIRGNEWLYVGMSGRGLARIFTHSIIGGAEAVGDSDSISVWVCKDYLEAQIKEKEIIMYTRPKYNFLHDRSIKEMACLKCGKLFTQKRWWQNWCSRECRLGGISTTTDKDVSSHSSYSFQKKKSEEKNEQQESLKEAECANVACKKTFPQTVLDRKYCSASCRAEQWNREHPRSTLAGN